MKRVLLVFSLLLFSSVVSAQVVTNPRGLAFTSVDHNHPEVTGYEIDIIGTDGTTVLSTSVIPKASTTVDSTTGEILVDVNVQPVAFGIGYTFIARTTTATVNSADSEPSETWNRAPGRPSGLGPR